MGSGLSMASVNKIKELANSREYSLALDIIDSQDLSKSLNPQFLRLCGEIYTRTGRYKDARRTLVMAHRIAPEAKRVIYSFLELYLRVGYCELARTYYDMYLFEADENSNEINQTKYIYGKANGADLNELEAYIAPTYSHTMDYEWSFETFLVFTINGKAESANELAEEYIATFKNSDNSKNIEDIVAGRKDAREFFDIYAKEMVTDDAAEDEDVRAEERKLLDADELRMHPKEAEITIIFDDNEENGIVSKRKLKKLFKEKEREEQEQSDDSSVDSEASEENTNSTETVKTGLFKKVFSKLKNPAKQDSLDSDKAESEMELVAEKPETVQPEDEAIAEKIETDHSEVGTISEETATAKAECEISVTEDFDSDENKPEMSDANEDSDMREIYVKHNKVKYNSIVSVDLDDDFTAESDTIENLKDDTDYGNPFESISAIKKDKEEYKFVPKRKSEVLFEDAEISPEEPDSEFEVDDFSEEPDSEFGEMVSDAYDIVSEIMDDEKTETESEPDSEIQIEVETEPEAEIEAEAEAEPESEIEAEAEAEPEAEMEAEAEAEPESEIEAEAEAEPDSEIQIEVETEPEAEIEAEAEAETEAEIEAEAEAEPETEIEAEAETEPELDIGLEAVEDEKSESDYYGRFERKKKKLDFPVFKSSLFPEYNQRIDEVENNFDEIMTEAHDKIQENKRKEEQMLKEAEELLASMGIHLDDVNVTSNSMESIGETLYNEPSRDELKASLKIDSVKKDILKKLKGYR